MRKEQGESEVKGSYLRDFVSNDLHFSLQGQRSASELRVCMQM